MKLTTSRRIHYESGPNMTPLVDVVMVILIFLMMAGSFGGAEHFLTSNVPLKQKGVGNVAIPTGFIPDEPLDIRVDSRGDGFEASAGRIRANSAAGLQLQLTSMRKQFEQAKTPIDKIQVVISPGKTTKYDHLIKVYEAALGAGFKKVAFATSHE